MPIRERNVFVEEGVTKENVGISKNDQEIKKYINSELKDFVSGYIVLLIITFIAFYIVGYTLQVNNNLLGELGEGVVIALNNIVNFLFNTGAIVMLEKLQLPINLITKIIAVVLLNISIGIILYLVEVSTPKSDYNVIIYTIIVLFIYIIITCLSHVSGIQFPGLQI